MKSSFSFLLCGLLLASGLSGCEKIKSLTSKKPPAAPADAKPSPVANTGAAAAGPVKPAPPRGDTSGAVAVFCYHRFENKKGQLIITPQEFEAQMKKLKDSGIEVISMKDFLAWRRGEKSIPPRSVIITLDDGWVSQYNEAWPILKKYGYPFTMFIYTDYVKAVPKSGGGSITWEQLEQMRDEGVDIECHTVTHSNLHVAKRGKTPEQYKAYLKNELETSKDMIEQHLAIKVHALAYPYGVYTEEAREVVKEAHYDAAFTVNPQKITFGSQSDLLGRYAVDGLTPKVFEAAINFGAGGSGPPSTETAPMAAASMLTKPAEGETVRDQRPVIEANLQAMGQFDPKTVEMRLSGYDVVPAKYDPATGVIRFQPPANLPPKLYTVIVHARSPQGKIIGTRWNFTVEAKP